MGAGFSRAPSTMFQDLIQQLSCPHIWGSPAGRHPLCSCPHIWGSPAGRHPLCSAQQWGPRPHPARSLSLAVRHSVDFYPALVSWKLCVLACSPARPWACTPVLPSALDPVCTCRVRAPAQGGQESAWPFLVGLWNRNGGRCAPVGGRRSWGLGGSGCCHCPSSLILHSRTPPTAPPCLSQSSLSPGRSRDCWDGAVQLQWLEVTLLPTKTHKRRGDSEGRERLPLPGNPENDRCLLSPSANGIPLCPSPHWQKRVSHFSGEKNPKDPASFAHSCGGECPRTLGRAVQGPLITAHQLQCCRPQGGGCPEGSVGRQDDSRILESRKNSEAGI